MVGSEIADASLVADVPRRKWRALYAALSDDLGTAADAAGPAAQQAWTRANQYTKASIQRLERLGSVVNRDAPEKIFKAATRGLADGGPQINRVIKSMPIEHRREVAAAVLQRLGRARNSARDEMGAAFSPESFLINFWGLESQKIVLLSNVSEVIFFSEWLTLHTAGTPTSSPRPLRRRTSFVCGPHTKMYSSPEPTLDTIGTTAFSGSLDACFMAYSHKNIASFALNSRGVLLFFPPLMQLIATTRTNVP